VIGSQWKGVLRRQGESLLGLYASRNTEEEKHHRPLHTFAERE